MDNDIILYETEFPDMYLAEDMGGGYFLVDEEGSIYDYDTGDLIQEDVVVLLNEMNYKNIHDKLTKKMNDMYNKKKDIYKIQNKAINKYLSADNYNKNKYEKIKKRLKKYNNGYENKLDKMHKVRIDAISHYNDKRPKGRSYILPKDISNAGKKAELPIDVKKFANRNKNLPVAVGKVNTAPVAVGKVNTAKDKAKTATRSTFTGNGAKKTTSDSFKNFKQSAQQTTHKFKQATTNGEKAVGKGANKVIGYIKAHPGKSAAIAAGTAAAAYGAKKVYNHIKNKNDYRLI